VRRARRTRASVVAVAVSATLLTGAGCDRPAPSASRPPRAAGSDAPPAAVVRVLAFAPISYFEESCAKCHGPYGSFWGEGFARGLSDDDLVRITEEMAAGPGGAPVAGEALLALAAYQRALGAGEPFLAITGAGEGELSGEVSPGTLVTVHAGGRSAPATVTGHRWVCRLPAGAGPIRVSALRAGARTELEGGARAFSHHPGPRAPAGPD